MVNIDSVVWEAVKGDFLLTLERLGYQKEKKQQYSLLKTLRGGDLAYAVFLPFIEHKINELELINHEIKQPDLVRLALYYDGLENVQRLDQELNFEDYLEDCYLPKYLTEEQKDYIFNLYAENPKTKELENDIYYFTDLEICHMGLPFEKFIGMHNDLALTYTNYDDYNCSIAHIFNDNLGYSEIYRTNHFQNRFEKQTRKTMKQYLQYFAFFDDLFDEEKKC